MNPDSLPWPKGLAWSSSCMPPQLQFRPYSPLALACFPCTLGEAHTRRYMPEVLPVWQSCTSWKIHPEADGFQQGEVLDCLCPTDCVRLAIGRNCQRSSWNASGASSERSDKKQGLWRGTQGVLPSIGTDESWWRHCLSGSCKKN